MSADHIGEASKTVAPVEAVAWRWLPLLKGKKEPWMEGDATPWVYRTGSAKPDFSAFPAGDIIDLQPLYTHPAPIKPSADIGELRERVAQIIGEAVNRRAPGQIVFSTLEDADAILDLIQSERAEPRVSILDTFFRGNNANGQPVFSGHADGVTNITLHGWTCFGPDEEGQRALTGFQSERAG